jgi:hypothetical protein
MRVRIAFLALSLLAAACSPLASSQQANPSPDSELTSLDQPESDPSQNRRVDDPTNYHINTILPRDAIRPVYDPEFVSASESPLLEDELIIGVAWEGEAKAYPISVLRFREMVNDELAGIPTLVTW